MEREQSGLVEQREAGYAERRGLIEDLDLQATLTAEDGKKVAYESCVVGKQLSITDPNGNAGDCNKQIPF